MAADEAGAVSALLSLAGTRSSSNNLLISIMICVVQGLRGGFHSIVCCCVTDHPMWGLQAKILIYFTHGPWGD